MKLFKVLTPVILSGFLALPAFAADEQNSQMQMQPQSQAQGQDQQANAARNEQVAASDTATQGNEAKASTNNGGKKGMRHKKCAKCKHKKGHGKSVKATEGENMSGQNTSENQPAQDPSQAPNQNS